MNAALRRLVSQLLDAAARTLPPHLGQWYRAMARELAEIPDDRDASAFGAGCLRALLAVAVAERLRTVAVAARTLLLASPPTSWRFPMKGLFAQPRLLGLLCGIGAVAAGLAYMLAAGAPSRYLMVNLAALVLGAALWLALGRTAASGLAKAGLVTLALAGALLLTALFGAVADGAARWVRVGPFNLQVSLVVVPSLIVLFARRPDTTGTIGVLAAAAALALQPDRAMAGVLAAALLCLAAAQPSRLSIVAAAGSMLAFGLTVILPDALPAVPFVDGILYSAFSVHMLAGVAVVAGAAALVAPAVFAGSHQASDRPVLWAFAGCWAATVAAAALGNYPTPLVGYGGSAVLGYLLSVALLPGGATAGHRHRMPGERSGAGGSGDSPISRLHAAGPA